MAGYFCDASGNKYDFADLAQEIHQKHPYLIGSHIFVQLQALGLYRAFLTGSTPCPLPYSFSSVNERWTDAVRNPSP